MIESRQIKIYIGDIFNLQPLSTFQARIKRKFGQDVWSEWTNPDSRNIFYFYNSTILDQNAYTIEFRHNQTLQIFSINNLLPLVNQTRNQNEICNTIQFNCIQFKREQFK